MSQQLAIDGETLKVDDRRKGTRSRALTPDERTHLEAAIARTVGVASPAAQTPTASDSYELRLTVGEAAAPQIHFVSMSGTLGESNGSPWGALLVWADHFLTLELEPLGVPKGLNASILE